MKVELTDNCYVDGKAYAAGDVVDTAKGALLIGIGKAVKYVEKPKSDAKPKKAVLSDKAPTGRSKRVVEPEVER